MGMGMGDNSHGEPTSIPAATLHLQVVEPAVAFVEAEPGHFCSLQVMSHPGVMEGTRLRRPLSRSCRWQSKRSSDYVGGRRIDA